MDEFDEPDQYSDQTRTALGDAVQQLSDALVEHATFVSGLHGGSAEMAGLFAANDKIARLVAAWSDRVCDHTGTTPVWVDLDDDELDEDDEDDDESHDEVADGDVLSVISRWDLLVEDVEALLAAGRAAHRRNRPEETDEDAAFAVDGPAMAIYAVLHESGEPLLRLPGVGRVQGVRLFIRPDDLPDAFGDEISREVTQPAGEVLFSEDWV